MRKKTLSFIDSNIFLYSLDESAAEKQQIALAAVREAGPKIVVSVQVMQEVYVNATGKLGIPPWKVRGVLEKLGRGIVVAPDAEMVLRAIDTSERNQISFWDSMIIEAAVAGKSSVVLTEDMNHGQTIRGVKIVNPFLAAK